MTPNQTDIDSWSKTKDSEWNKERFADLMKSMRNGMYKKKDFYGNGTQIVKMGELFDSEFITNQKQMDRLELTDKELDKHGLKKGDLLFARRSYVREGSGKCSIIDQLKEPLVPESSIIRARPDDNKINPLFLYYYFKSSVGRNEIDKIIRQTAVSGIAQSDLKEVTVSFPCRQEQNVIVDVLKTIDEKIQVNEDIGELLVEVAEQIFQRRFVEFTDYSEFKQTSIGEIPIEFDLKPLEDVLVLQRGYSYSGEDLIDEESEIDSEDGYPMINLGNIKPGGGYRPEKIKYTNKVPKERYLVESGDLIISHTDMTQDKEILGSPVIVPDLEQSPMLFSHHLYLIEESDLPKEYLYYYFLSPYFKPMAENFASGTTVLSFSSKITSDVQVPVPPEDALRDYLDVVKPMFEKTESIRKENKQLIELRDTLLPKLMSGDIRVNDINLEDLEVGNEV